MKVTLFNKFLNIETDNRQRLLKERYTLKRFQR